MAEIKSTIDLVMERTKHLVMSGEEKKHQDALERIDKIPGVFQRYLDGLDGLGRLDELMEMYRGIPAEYRHEARRKLLVSAMERVSLETPSAFIGGVGEVVGKDDPASMLLEELQEIQRQYGERAEALKRRIAGDIEEQLREREIEGDAVVVVPEETAPFASLVADYRGKFETCKNRIAQS